MDRNLDPYGATLTKRIVALRKESVDRNLLDRWQGQHGQHVALRKESVDRNSVIAEPLRQVFSRSPQGERG